MSFYIKSWHAQKVLPMAMLPQKNIHQIHFFFPQTKNCCEWNEFTCLSQLITEIQQVTTSKKPQKSTLPSERKIWSHSHGMPHRYNLSVLLYLKYNKLLELNKIKLNAQIENISTRKACLFVNWHKKKGENLR